MESTSEKKWYIVEQGSPEDEDMELEYSPLSGYMKIHPEGFNTASEAKKVFTENYREYKGVYHGE